MTCGLQEPAAQTLEGATLKGLDKKLDSLQQKAQKRLQDQACSCLLFTSCVITIPFHRHKAPSIVTLTCHRCRLMRDRAFMMIRYQVSDISTSDTMARMWL